MNNESNGNDTVKGQGRREDGPKTNSSDYLFNTTAGEESRRNIQMARTRLQLLREYLGRMDDAMGNWLAASGNDGAFPIEWCTEAVSGAMSVMNYVARCNGAAMVRGKEPVSSTTVTAETAGG